MKICKFRNKRTRENMNIILNIQRFNLGNEALNVFNFSSDSNLVRNMAVLGACFFFPQKTINSNSKYVMKTVSQHL